MPTPHKGLLRFLGDLAVNQQIRRQPAAPAAALPASLAALRAWQAGRLARTYADLLASRQYAPACRFFLSDIYSARDFSQRDADAERLHELLARYLPAFMLRLLDDTLQLNRLSNQLDRQLSAELVEQFGTDQPITPQHYAQAYRLCDNYALRKRQIDLLASTLREAASGAHAPLVGAVLRLARRPAKHARWGDLHDFLARGYQACKPLRDVSGFVETIQRREMSILDKIVANQAQPFAPWLPDEVDTP